MKYLIDADVILEYCLNREQFVKDTEYLWSLLESQKIEGFITESGLNKIEFYFSQLTSDEKAKNLIKDLKKLVKICPVDRYILDAARKSNLKDFEAAVEIECAIKFNCDAIIVWNYLDFEGASIEIILVNPLTFEPLQTVDFNKQQKKLEYEARYSNPSYLSSFDNAKLRAYVAEAEARVKAIEMINEIKDDLAKNSVNFCFEEYPHLKNPGEPQNSQVFIDKCYDEISRCLNLVLYCILCGDPYILTDRELSIAHPKLFPALNLPTDLYVAALTFCRDSVSVSRNLSKEVLKQYRSYLDYLINSLS
ncbi:Phycobilisome protein [Gloeothece citriformis PCC 7424]|uniref:Phycobilisome protein n=1 Tax=Gloeothece citriformis (strain PCC 7424) TaxID=65393 RepID=B7KD47_GLOC7|nr:PIN domain-containing protein [Gloeothece citriformis]ACK73168.1 Phycobilisome protein [Gloeothece citriformis PCC 7424]